MLPLVITWLCLINRWDKRPIIPHQCDEIPTSASPGLCGVFFGPWLRANCRLGDLKAVHIKRCDGREWMFRCPPAARGINQYLSCSRRSDDPDRMKILPPALWRPRRRHLDLLEFSCFPILFLQYSCSDSRVLQFSYSRTNFWILLLPAVKRLPQSSGSFRFLSWESVGC